MPSGRTTSTAGSGLRAIRCRAGGTIRASGPWTDGWWIALRGGVEARKMTDLIERLERCKHAYRDDMTRGAMLPRRSWDSLSFFWVLSSWSVLALAWD